jgi:uncharacterized protein YbjT (DUF2867 family)
MTTSILMCGVTGLVGRALLEQLLADDHFDPVLALARRPLNAGGRSARLHLCTVDFADLDAHAELFRVQQIFWALGSTIRQAGSQERFRAIEYGYAEKVARLGRAGGAQHFLLVSALAAAADSRVFYNRVKGEVEEMIQGIGFRSVTIVRPSILIGHRPEFGLGEAIAKRLLMVAPLKYRAVDARDVARAWSRRRSATRPASA